MPKKGLIAIPGTISASGSEGLGAMQIPPVSVSKANPKIQNIKLFEIKHHTINVSQSSALWDINQAEELIWRHNNCKHNTLLSLMMNYLFCFCLNLEIKYLEASNSTVHVRLVHIAGRKLQKWNLSLNVTDVALGITAILSPLIVIRSGWTSGSG